MKAAIFIMSAVLFLAVSTTAIVKSIHLNQNCTGYLKRAADSSTPEKAKQELDRAIDYLERRNLTSGYTSIIYKTPDEDIGFWYQNLKAAQSELSKVDSTTSSLEKTNLLMKLRETLIDNAGESGDSLTAPNGLSRYPNNLLFGILLSASLLGIIITVGWWVVEDGI